MSEDKRLLRFRILWNLSTISPVAKGPVPLAWTRYPPPQRLRRSSTARRGRADGRLRSRYTWNHGSFQRSRLRDHGALGSDAVDWFLNSSASRAHSDILMSFQSQSPLTIIKSISNKYIVSTPSLLAPPRAPCRLPLHLPKLPPSAPALPPRLLLAIATKWKTTRMLLFVWFYYQQSKHFKSMIWMKGLRWYDRTPSIISKESLNIADEARPPKI